MSGTTIIILEVATTVIAIKAIIEIAQFIAFVIRKYDKYNAEG